MESLLTSFWNVLRLPQVWGFILTFLVIAISWFIKGWIQHSLEVSLEKMKFSHSDLELFREHYSGIKDYSSIQAEALRQSYLILFEPSASILADADQSLEMRLELAIDNILKPLRSNLGIIDENTAKKIYALANFLRNYKGRAEELKNKKISIYDMSDSIRKYIKVDRIAYRLGIVNHFLKEATMVKIRVLSEGISV